MSLKTAEQYSKEIAILHGELKALKPGSALHTELSRKLANRLGSWQDRLSITVYVANNEQLPWELENFDLKPMCAKKNTGYSQVGDYIFEINHGDSTQSWGHLCVERKTCSDLYGTLMNRASRERFYREISRFEADRRFTQMVIIAECTQAEFLTYIPVFNGKKRNTNHISASVESRRATIAGLYIRGVPILWAGSRAEAQKTYSQLVRQSCIKNYVEILGLDR